MAALCEIRVPQKKGAERAARMAIEEVRRIEAKYSRFTSNSVTTAINRSAGKSSYVCDPETMALLAFASTMFELSGGLFDLTSGVLRKAWKFQNKSVRSNAASLMPPSKEAIAKLLPLVGWEKLKLDDGLIRLPIEGMEIDFGGIGKEYAADRARQILIQEGLDLALIDLGGDLATFGSKPDGSPWSLGIRHPRITDQLLATIPMRSGALATSGDYERSFVSQGIRYCHILNPKTGWPCQYWQSISVAGTACLSCGAFATIAMLLESDASEFLGTYDTQWIGVGPHGDTHQA